MALSLPKHPFTPLASRASIFVLTFTIACLAALSGFLHELRLVFPSHPEPPCANVYIDLGSNNAKSIAEFINASEATAHQEVQDVIHYRNNNNLDVADFCVYGFEPNPAHSKSHAAVYAQFASNVRLLKIFSETAAGPVDGWTTLTVDQFDGEFPAWGSSVMSDYTGLQKKLNGTVRVRTLNFQSFLENHVIPSLKPGGKILMRVDVEGSEFVLMRDLIASGLACRYIDHLAIEWHDIWYGTSARCIRSMFQWILSNPKCKTGWARETAPSVCDGWNMSDQFNME